MRDSFIFYRSFFEAINDLDDMQQLEIYKAVANYSLNFVESDLKGVSATIFKLIKPQLEANNKRFLNGTQPKSKHYESKTEAKQKQVESKTEANSNNNVNNNVNNNANEKGNKKLEISNEKKEFSFSLSKETQYENVSSEYKDKLKEEIEKLNLSLSYEDFTDSLIAKGYKYKNFLLAYKTWCKKDFNKSKSSTTNSTDEWPNY